MRTIPDDEISGVPVTTTLDIIANSLDRLAKSGAPLLQSTGRAR